MFVVCTYTYICIISSIRYPVKLAVARSFFSWFLSIGVVRPHASITGEEANDNVMCELCARPWGTVAGRAEPVPGLIKGGIWPVSSRDYKGPRDPKSVLF